MLSIRHGVHRLSSSLTSHSLPRRGLSTVSVCIRTIREDGEKQYLDMDVDLSVSLLDSLKGKVPIQCRRDGMTESTDGCGGKGICGQCQIALPKDVYNRIPKPTQGELDTLATSLDPPPKSICVSDIIRSGRLACQVVPTPIFRGRTIDVFIPFE